MGKHDVFDFCLLFVAMGKPKGFHVTLKTWFKDSGMILRDHSQLNQKSYCTFFPLKTVHPWQHPELWSCDNFIGWSHSTETFQLHTERWSNPWPFCEVTSAAPPCNYTYKNHTLIFTLNMKALPRQINHPPLKPTRSCFQLSVLLMPLSRHFSLHGLI